MSVQTPMIPAATEVMLTGRTALADYQQFTDLLAAKRQAYAEAKEAEDQVRRQLGEARDQIRVYEANLMAAVQAETDPATGKARHSNDKAREAALAQLKAHDEDYQGAAAWVRENEAMMDKVALAREIAERDYNDMRLMLRYRCAALAVLAGEAVSEATAGALGVR